MDTVLNKLPTNRSFGITFAGFFCIVAWFKFFGAGYSAAQIWLCISVSCFLTAIFSPNILLPLNKLWTKFGLLLHSITSPILMGAVFYIIVMPMGVVMRMFGWDPLRMQFNKQAESYWITRANTVAGMKPMQYQF
jgi:hypothetical protein